MFVLPGFWHAAARLSGRVDWSVPLRTAAAASLPTLDAEGLVSLGVPPPRAAALVAAPACHSADPVLTLADAGWPESLRGLPYAPAVLFARGNLSLLAEPCVAIVGTRRCTDLGRRMARALARGAVEAGAVVVSGLAYGIDACAHEVALERTIAVLGQGLDAPLQRHQQPLADAILRAGGLLLSEFPPGTPPAVFTFPQRNRVIAGLSRATVVVEAGQRSGALITARLAVDYGREVLAVPGSPLAEASAGCLSLLAQGARLCRGADDLAHALGLDTPRARPVEDPLGLLAALGGGAGVDELVDRTGADAVTLLRALAALELTGVVERLPGDRYTRRTSP